MSLFNNSNSDHRLQALEKITTSTFETLKAFETAINLVDGKVTALKKIVDTLIEQNQILQERVSESENRSLKICSQMENHLREFQSEIGTLKDDLKEKFDL